ncbi:MAG: NUDIX domain-containing protein [Alphaproteobacteria bacterium]|jgi:ADP-ribose pyrophosphatase YjhB (NUDIX family)|nr:NUDIX domain-containing protein [Alphaproteobacteria bacterium]
MGVDVNYHIIEEGISNVRALVFSRNKGKVFLIKRTKKDRPVYWTYPGGHVEDGETVQETLEREILEELGIRICKVEPFMNYEFEDGSKQLFYTCKEAEEFERVEPTGPEFTTPREDNKFEVHEVDLEEIKNLNVLPEEITEMFCFKYDLD